MKESRFINTILYKDAKLYLNEKDHIYNDEGDLEYISATQLIQYYFEEFDTIGIAKSCAKVGRNPFHPKYDKYRGMSIEALINLWNKDKVDGLDKGNRKHNYFEDAIKRANNYRRIEGKYINDRLHTIFDIIDNPKVGQLNLDYFIKTGIDKRYPEIYDFILKVVSKGYRIYAEVGVHVKEYLLSGLIDVLFLNPPYFVILDWKTNKALLRWESGYYEKDGNRRLTEKYIKTNKYLRYPISHLQASDGNKYSIQVSEYAYMLEYYGLQCKKIVLAHIRDDEVTGKENVEWYDMPYLKDDVGALIQHFNKAMNRVPYQRKILSVV